MGSTKRKRQSTDSAIADMSSEESIVVESESQATSEKATLEKAISERAVSERAASEQAIPEEAISEEVVSVQANEICHFQQEEESQSKRPRRSWSFDARDFGTAASQRPRRGATGTSTAAVVPAHSPCTRSGSQEAFTDVSASTSAVEPVRERDQKVKGNNEKRRQTHRRKQAPTMLPTPPPSAEKTSSQSPSQASPRRSTRERRPPERYRQPSVEQETPCRKKTEGSIASETNKLTQEPSVTKTLTSRVVRLRVQSPSIQNGGSQMSLTGSFSFRQKGGDEQDSQTSQHQVSRLESEEVFYLTS